jgi:hypothetical protein
MNYFSAASLALAGILPAPFAAAVAQDAPQNRAVAEAVRALPMQFDKVPLGNVARLLSARFSVTVSIAANAKAPVTGNFSSLDLKAALAECARQAGLTVVPLGTAASDGFSLEPPKAQPPAGRPGGNDTNPSEKKTDDRAAIAAAAARRVELFRLRKALAAQELTSQGSESADAATGR